MEEDRKYLLAAFEEAERSMKEGTYPIGAVLVNSLGEIVSKGRNKVFSECDTTAHAEVEVIRRASVLMLDIDNKKYKKRDLTLYTTCEPCLMCSGAILLSFSIKRVVWAANDISMGAMRKLKKEPLFIDRFSDISIEAAPIQELEDRQRKMMAEFFSNRGRIRTEWHDG
ncbi:nucleoside deaminase [Paenibacillus albiflavus]|uniref:Nucleoside deaminase n=1 Tax=Paenibacillus albiflavus TaxID=2545760 RepID=A0A4R4ERM0_9BACL|nr:nucleoside deaminase [Paenibacillus albiflavus]TCZ81088.1 nucleoside deaminase [Paenibacillus albiflavus]